MLPKHATYLLLRLLISWTCLCSEWLFAEVSTDFSKEHTETSSRLRVTATSFNLTQGDAKFSANGAELTYDTLIRHNWAISATFGQAFATGISGNIDNLLTNLDATIWYSLWGSFAESRLKWRDAWTTVADYTPQRRSGFRMGLGSQQYFLNSSATVLPYSGPIVKLLYEFGLSTSFDLGLGLDISRLKKNDDRISSIKTYLSIILPMQ